MNAWRWGLGLVTSVTVVFACSSSKPTGTLAADAGSGDAEPSLDAGESDASDASAGDFGACDPGAVSPAWAFVVGASNTASSIAYANLATNKVEHDATFEGAYGGVSVDGAFPFWFGGETDVVARLDAREPWKTVATWNVRGDDKPADGNENANPVAVVQTACNKAFVLRFNRDRIAVIDPTDVTSKAPKSFIDLSSLKRPTDTGTVDMVAATYVPSRRQLLVLVAHMDLTKVSSDGFTMLCTSNRPELIAVNVDTESVESLGGTGIGGGIELDGYNPVLGAPIEFDSKSSTAFVLEAGCNEADADGGTGAVVRRRVEAVSLTTRAVSTVVSLDNRDFPSSIAVATEKLGVVAMYGTAGRFDPSAPGDLSPVVGGATYVAPDGTGKLLGLRDSIGADGESGPLQLVRLGATDTETEVLLTSPFASAEWYAQGFNVWRGRR